MLSIISQNKINRMKLLNSAPFWKWNLPEGIDIKKIEYTKGIIRIGKSKKDRQHNDQKIKDKRTNNSLQNIGQLNVLSLRFYDFEHNPVASLINIFLVYNRTNLGCTYYV